MTTTENDYKPRYIKKKCRTEAELEKATKDAIARELGALVFKFVSPQKRGVPDDIILLPCNIAVFVEFKNPTTGGALSKIQEVRIGEIRALGFDVFVVGSVQTAETIIDYLREVISNADVE